MVRYFGDRDPTSRRMMEEILAVEEVLADDLVDLLHDMPVAWVWGASYGRMVAAPNSGSSGGH